MIGHLDLTGGIELSFVANSGLSSRMIEYFGAGSFSHVDYVLPPAYCKALHIPSGSLLGARSDYMKLVTPRGLPFVIPPGVRIRPPNYEHWPRRLILSIPATEAESRAMLTFCTDQIGKPYDKIGILGFIVGRDWRAPDSWFCSELATRGLEHAKGIKLPLPVYKITPGDCALISGALGGLSVYSSNMPQF